MAAEWYRASMLNCRWRPVVQVPEQPILCAASKRQALAGAPEKENGEVAARGRGTATGNRYVRLGEQRRYNRLRSRRLAIHVVVAWGGKGGGGTGRRQGWKRRQGI